jgi:hypothetical protein
MRRTVYSATMITLVLVPHGLNAQPDQVGSHGTLVIENNTDATLSVTWSWQGRTASEPAQIAPGTVATIRDYLPAGVTTVHVRAPWVRPDPPIAGPDRTFVVNYGTTRVFSIVVTPEDFGTSFLADAQSSFSAPAYDAYEDEGGSEPPDYMRVCESSAWGTYCADWRLAGRAYEGQWDNGARATINIVRWGRTVELSRVDTEGTSRGYEATYTGTVTGNEIVDGAAVATWDGHFNNEPVEMTWTGEW